MPPTDTIPAESSNTAPLVPPVLPPDSLTGLLNTANQNNLNSQNALNTASTEYSNLLTQLSGAQGDYNAQLDSSGYNTFNKELSDLNALQTQQQAGYLSSLNRQNTGATSIQERSVGEQAVSRQHGIDALLTSSLIQAKSGQINQALATVKSAIDAKYEPIRAQLEAKKFILDQLNTKAAEDRKLAIDLQMKQLDTQAETEKTIQNLALGASKNGATDAVIKAITDSTNINDAIRLAAKYAVSPADKLDLAIKGMQLQKLQKENALIGQPTEEEIKAQLDAMKTAKGSVPVLEDKIALLDSILSGKASRAINSVVGTTMFTRGPGTFGGVVSRTLTPGAQGSLVGGTFDKITGSRQDLIGSVNQLVSKEFLQAVLNLKSSGGTLGQLTEREGEKLQNAATKIGTWEIRDKRGNVIGYNASEKDFRAEIQRIKNATQMILNSVRNSTFSSDETDLLDSIYGGGTNDVSSYFQ